MKTKNTFFHARNLVVMDATGELDMRASVLALTAVAADPNFDVHTEVLLDLRDTECHLSIADIADLARAMAWPRPMLPTHRKIAVLVEGRKEFDHAEFLERCGNNRGMHMKAFDDYDQAGEWLGGVLPADAKPAISDVSSAQPESFS